MRTSLCTVRAPRNTHVHGKHRHVTDKRWMGMDTHHPHLACVKHRPAVRASSSGEYLADIPRTIHQVWLGPATPPEYWLNQVRAWCNAQEGWTYRLWQAQDLLQLRAWATLEPLLKNVEQFRSSIAAGKVDLLRVAILQEHGGVYVDTDIVPLESKSLTPEMLLAVPRPGVTFLAAHEPPAMNKLRPSPVANSLVAVAAGHPFLTHWREFQERMLTAAQPSDPVWHVLGPGCLTLALAEYRRTHVEDESIHLLSHERWYGEGWLDTKKAWPLDPPASSGSGQLLHQFGSSLNGYAPHFAEYATDFAQLDRQGQDPAGFQPGIAVKAVADNPAQEARLRRHLHTMRSSSASADVRARLKARRTGMEWRSPTQCDRKSASVDDIHLSTTGALDQKEIKSNSGEMLAPTPRPTNASPAPSLLPPPPAPSLSPPPSARTSEVVRSVRCHELGFVEHEDQWAGSESKGLGHALRDAARQACDANTHLTILLLWNGSADMDIVEAAARKVWAQESQSPNVAQTRVF